jgi:type I restriction enzyme, S subunit
LVVRRLPIIRIQNLNNEKANYNYFNSEINQKYIIKARDILISWSASIGVYEWQGVDAVLNQHIFKVEFNKDEINKTYFKYIVGISLNRALNYLHGSTMKHITKKYFDDILIPVPDLSTQKYIAQLLGHSESLIEKRSDQIKAISSLTQSLFWEMFGNPVKNEKNWKVFKLSEIGELKRGLSKHGPRNAPELLNGPYPLIQTGDISKSNLYISKYNQTYSELGLKQSKLWPKGTLCITIAANIAQTGILSFDACFPDSVVAFISKDVTSNIYMHYWFSFFQKIIEASAPESAQKNINLKINP